MRIADDRIGSLANQGSDKLDQAVADYVQHMNLVWELKEQLYPTDVPNKACRHALVSGLLFDNSRGVRVHDLVPVLKLPHETLYLWAHTKDQYASLVSEVDPAVKDLPLWRNAGEILRFAHAFETLFEHMQPTFRYHWIYRFDPAKDVLDCEFMENDVIASTTRLRGMVERTSFFYRQAPIISLLVRDERFYCALSFLTHSMEAFYSCLLCELQKGNYKMHPNHEPPIWEQAASLPRIESAIVQASRAIESILCQPGKDRGRAAQRWENAIELNRDDVYSKTGQTYFEYFYELYRVRGDSAHSRGTVSFETTRQKLIEVQCFAFLVLDSYASKRMQTQDEAAHAVGLNSVVCKPDAGDIDVIAPGTLD